MTIKTHSMCISILINKRNTILISYLVAFLSMNSSSFAKCTSDGKLSFRPITNDVVSVAMTCDSKGTNKTFKPGAGYKFTATSAVSSPRSGRLETSIAQFKYKPRKGFSGSDSFSLKVCATKDGQSGCSTINYAVLVQ